jgi:hypothetical protein
MKNFAGVDDRVQPRAALARAAHRLEQPQKFGFGSRAGVFAQGGAERGMADLAMGDERGRIGGEKGERPLCVLAVLGEMEMHPTDMPPAAVARGEKGVEARAACGEFVLEGMGEFSPQRHERAGVEIFAASHRRRFVVEAGDFCLARLRGARLPRPAAGGDEPHRQTAPEGEIGGQARAGLAEAELQEPMARSARERRLEPRGDDVIQRSGRFRSLQAKRAARGYDSCEAKSRRRVSARVHALA